MAVPKVKKPKQGMYTAKQHKQMCEDAVLHTIDWLNADWSEEK